MSTLVSVRDNVLADFDDLSKAERQELMALGLLSTAGSVRPFREVPHEPGYSSVERQAVCAPSVLNEACEYGSAFSRGLRLDLGSYSLIFISGTASVDEVGNTVHKGDLRAQCWRTYRNITELLNAQGATWQDVVKCTCYLRDIERDYEEFNRLSATESPSRERRHSGPTLSGGPARRDRGDRHSQERKVAGSSGVSSGHRDAQAYPVLFYSERCRFGHHRGPAPWWPTLVSRRLAGLLPCAQTERPNEAS